MTTLEHSVGATIGEVGAVEEVHVFRDGDNCAVFTIVDEPQEDVFDDIYEIERALIHRFNDLRFDFNVISRHGRPVEELVSFQAPASQRS